MFTLILAKTTKSLQATLNEIVPRLSDVKATVTNRAYSKARAKLRHSAFIELNRECVLPAMYDVDEYETYKGMRVLAVDGSKIMLPDNLSTNGYFGRFDSSTPSTPNAYCQAMASVLYDVLNGVCIDAVLAHGHAAEVDLAIESLKFAETDDLVIYDRGYCGFRMLSAATDAKGHFLIRCHRKSFQQARDMFDGLGDDDITVTLEPGYKHLRQDITKPVTVRFVRVELDTGETEVLATSLLDRVEHPTEDFKDLYWKRWGVETFYKILKSRLDIENFTGLSAESVLQDFHASVFLTGIEAVFAQDANETLQQKDTKHDYKVNKAVAFNALKSRAFDVLLSGKPTDEVITELEALFLTNPVAMRPNRAFPREDPNMLRRKRFWRRSRKTVY